MKEYFGKPQGVDRSILGKIVEVTGTCNDWKIHSASSLASGDCYICSFGEYSLGSEVGGIFEIDGSALMNVGDVLKLSPDGKVRVLFDSSSNENVLFLTGYCNANCVFCPQPTGPGDFNSPDEVREFLGLLPEGIQSLGISGGEPTLERALLVAAIESAKLLLPEARIDVLSNGILLSDFNYAKQVAQIEHPLLSFDVPLYSDISYEHDRIVGVDGFGNSIQGIFNLYRLKQVVGVRGVISKLNYSRLPNLAEFICRNLPFVSHIALMGMEVYHKARDNFDEVWIDPHNYKDELTEAVRILHRADLPVFIYNHPLCILPRSLWPFAISTISEWKRGFGDECENCFVQDDCGGIFTTSGQFQSHFIQPIGDRCQPPNFT